MMHPAFAYLDVAPRALGNVVDDLAFQVAKKFDDAVAPQIVVFADHAYDEFRARFEQDKDALVTEIVDAAKPKVQKAVYAILDDAQTQARLGAAQDEFKAALTKALLVTAAGTAIATWALVTYVGKP